MPGRVVVVSLSGWSRCHPRTGALVPLPLRVPFIPGGPPLGAFAALQAGRRSSSAVAAGAAPTIPRSQSSDANYKQRREDQLIQRGRRLQPEGASTSVAAALAASYPAIEPKPTHRMSEFHAQFASLKAGDVRKDVEVTVAGKRQAEGWATALPPCLTRDSRGGAAAL